MHTILGAGGPVANILTGELLKNGHRVKLISRRKIERFTGAEWVKADLTQKNEVLEAAKGATVLYMVAGLKYDKKAWAAQWPVIMSNIIEAAKQNNARLIFFDNVYMYGHVNGKMTEETPYNPSSVKGKIRAKIAQQLMDEIKKGNIKGSIARAADFYGAESMNSFLDSMVLAKFAKGLKATWLGNPQVLHNFTFVPDAGKDMYILGQHPESDGQIWHLRTAPALKGEDIMKIAARTFGAPMKYSRINKFMLDMVGLFNPLIRETSELYYQYKYDYIFDSSKFEKTFGLQPTAYEDGFKYLKY